MARGIRTVAVGVGVLILLVVAGVSLVAPAMASAQTVDCDNPRGDDFLTTEEDALLVLINQYRAELGLQAFSVSPTLQRAAVWKATQLADSVDLTLPHDDPFRTWEQRFLDCGYPSSAYFSENMGATMGATADDLIAAWKVSPIHDPNLRDPALTFIGVARVESQSGQVFWVTTFGSDPT